jgi:hypothetical protein
MAGQGLKMPVFTWGLRMKWRLLSFALSAAVHLQKLFCPIANVL